MGGKDDRAKVPNEQTTAKRGGEALNWRDITFLDLFPYNPTYSFNGFRSLYGAVLSIMFLFCVFLRIVTTSDSFYNSKPEITTAPRYISSLGETNNMPLMASRMVYQGSTFSDTRAFQLHFEQGRLQAGSSVRYIALGTAPCQIDDPARLVRYTGLSCPAETGTLKGDFPLSDFRFVRVRVEQCRNTTVWNPSLFAYEVDGSTTAGPGVPCLSESSINVISQGLTVLLYLKEELLNPDSFYRVSTYIFSTQRRLLTGSFVSNQVFLHMTKIVFLSRYVFEKYDTVERYMKVQSIEQTYDDAQEVVGEDNQFHLNRLEFVFRYSRIWDEEFRDHQSIYSLFESWAASTIFFTGAFGLLAWLINRYFFLQQTKGLDIRKMDRDQFDRYGRLVDKSFQMPRELQDMKAE